MSSYLKNMTGYAASGFLAFCLFVSLPAFAQCEDPASGTSEMQGMANDGITDINDYINELWNMTDEDLTNTASTELADRMDEFSDNVYPWLNDWWDDRFRPALQDMTKQLSSAQVDQTRQLGTLLEAQLYNEASARMQEKEMEAHRRYQPSTMACQADSMRNAPAKGLRMSRALARGFAQDNVPRGFNTTGSSSQFGRGREINDFFAEYVTYFCDFTRGDQGCTADGTMPGKSTDLPSMLWGDTQTINMTNADTRRSVSATLRTLVQPFSYEPIPGAALDSNAGRSNFMMRRARQARINTVYNAIGQMVGERVGGTGQDIRDIRLAAGTNAASLTDSTDASYRDIQESLTRARFQDPKYIVNMVEDPEQVVREQGSVNALRLQQWSEFYDRAEDELYMEAAAYAEKLDARRPSNNAYDAAPMD